VLTGRKDVQMQNDGFRMVSPVSVFIFCWSLLLDYPGGGQPQRRGVEIEMVLQQHRSRMVRWVQGFLALTITIWK